MIELSSKDAKYCRKCFVTQSRRVHDAWPYYSLPSETVCALCAVPRRKSDKVQLQLQLLQLVDMIISDRVIIYNSTFEMYVSLC